MRKHRRVAFAPLIERHFQGAFQRSRDPIGLMRIDDQRLVEFLRSARNSRARRRCQSKFSGCPGCVSLGA